MAANWLAFLAQYYKRHKSSGKSYKDCMKLAAVEWKKKGKGKGKAAKGGKLKRKKKAQIEELEKPKLKKRRRVKK
jgi:Spy/CpxP family protein refolding chaperone